MDAFSVDEVVLISGVFQVFHIGFEKMVLSSTLVFDSK